MGYHGVYDNFGPLARYNILIRKRNAKVEKGIPLGRKPKCPECGKMKNKRCKNSFHK